MKASSIFTTASTLIAGLASMVSGHTYLSHIYPNGKRYAEGAYSKSMTCGISGYNNSTNEICPVKAGSTMTIEWHRYNDTMEDYVLTHNHMGPCLVYMAPKDSRGHGDVWFKIFEDGYDPKTKKWCAQKVIDNHGKIDIKLPADIKAGDYLLRTEIIALHNAADINGAQYYPNCAQLRVTDGGSSTPKGYAIPGVYKKTDPGIHFDLKTPFTSYPIPGPPLYQGSSQTMPAGSSDSGPAKAGPSCTKGASKQTPLAHTAMGRYSTAPAKPSATSDSPQTVTVTAQRTVTQFITVKP
ncbi:hypothetical protein DL89DRAFT_265373 [Linderina pennispora]|uniref:AA9 family lytic polysaccharide monooxygenase n=1 Tax=Linderina pennispora TaxID=61395 RepID=A0A1Y1WJ37_9FUNG|nr:uncharacterized protein DL89DRAFT_265373 [Linderina pennispora]ORX73236.1 hypothetical protein DL89DRAFT_265373 [Linderina pennispora]